MLSAAVWLMLSSMLCSLRVAGGGNSFPKPLSAEEERHYLALSTQGDLAARNVLIERNLRLVAHIMKKYYSQSADQEDRSHQGHFDVRPVEGRTARNLCGPVCRK